MARAELITDDLTGEKNATPVHIEIDGQAWTIDLAKASRAQLNKALRPFLSKATRVTTGTRAATVASRSKTRQKASTTTTTASTVAQRGEIRQWAADHDIALPSRGRIPKAIVAQFQDATG